MSFGDDTLDPANEEEQRTKDRIREYETILVDLCGLPDGYSESPAEIVMEAKRVLAGLDAEEAPKLKAIRTAMKIGDEYDLVSFATTLTARSELLDTLESFIRDFVKPLADGVGHMRGNHGRSKVRDMRFGNLLDALDSCWDSIERHMVEKATKFPWEK